MVGIGWGLGMGIRAMQFLIGNRDGLLALAGMLSCCVRSDTSARMTLFRGQQD